MGTWGAGPFDNDTAADFAGDLDDMLEQERSAAVRAALEAAVLAKDGLDGGRGDVAVAAAALVAAQCPGGEPTDPIYGPEQPLPDLPAELRPLAVEALSRVIGPDSELPGLWAGSDKAAEWHADVAKLRAVLTRALADPDRPSPPMES